MLPPRDTRPRLMLAPELFEALSQLFQVSVAALVGYSHHCLPPAFC
jgi:hypothetical protein